MMIGFPLTEQQRNIRELAHNFAPEGDPTGRLGVRPVDVVTGQELRLSNGPVLDAILASAAIPGAPERTPRAQPASEANPPTIAP
jgi:predicted acylesterase/phospholipase RssA